MCAFLIDAFRRSHIRFEKESHTRSLYRIFSPFFHFNFFSKGGEFWRFGWLLVGVVRVLALMAHGLPWLIPFSLLRLLLVVLLLLLPASASASASAAYSLQRTLCLRLFHRINAEMRLCCKISFFLKIERAKLLDKLAWS